MEQIIVVTKLYGVIIQMRTHTIFDLVLGAVFTLAGPYGRAIPVGAVRTPSTQPSTTPRRVP